MMHRTLGALVLAVACLSGAAADELTPEKRADILRLIELSGGASTARQFADAASRQMFAILKASRPDIPDRALGIMERELSALFSEKLSAPGGLSEMVIPIYDKYFTHAELRDLLAFYRTPAGQKAITVLPMVLQESMQAGQRWGQSLGPEIERRIVEALRREGVLPAFKPPPGT